MWQIAPKSRKGKQEQQEGAMRKKHESNKSKQRLRCKNQTARKIFFLLSVISYRFNNIVKIFEKNMEKSTKNMQK